MHSLPSDAQRPRLVVGTMTGTSLDGIDVAVASVEGKGLAMTVALRTHASVDFPPALGASLRALAEQRPMTARDVASLARSFALFHAEAIRSLLEVEAIRADLIVAHGQTVFHAPPVSWQLLQPAPMVELLGTTTVCDLRQADLAAGGQGAPITPLADWILFRGATDRAVINLGGFCNVTFLPGGSGPEGVRGADICACNQVLDAVARRVLHRPFDPDGAAAGRGIVDVGATDRLMAILRDQRGRRRSLGTGDEASMWVERELERLRPEDLAASAATAVGTVIGESATQAGLTENAELLLAGGGARHRPLVEAIALANGDSSGTRTRPLNAYGVPIEAREALEMAVLGALAQDGLSITLAAVTGRQPPQARDGLWCFAR
jgi:anhydro-N-acetylmuramic acid kinase